MAEHRPLAPSCWREEAGRQVDWPIHGAGLGDSRGVAPVLARHHACPPRFPQLSAEARGGQPTAGPTDLAG